MYRLKQKRGNMYDNLEELEKSIENCKNSDENYFSILVKGDKFKFDKYVDERDSVNNNYIIFKLIGTTY